MAFVTTKKAVSASLLAFLVLWTPLLSAQPDSTDACIVAAEQSQGLRKSGGLRAARVELLRCASESCPGPIASDCMRWLAEVEDATPTVVFRSVNVGGEEQVEVRVLVDDALVASRLDGRPIQLDPGEHSVTLEANGRIRLSTTLVARTGEHDRLVSFTLPPDTAAAEPPSPPRGFRVPVVSWIVGSAGLVAMGVGVDLWIRGRSERVTLEDTCGKTRTCTLKDEDSAKSKLLVGDIAFGAGLVSLGLATWLAWRTIPSVNVHPVAGGAVVGYGAAF
jgi:hypothetical protein